MATDTGARMAILASIRKSLGAASSPDAIDAEYVETGRDYKQQGSLSHDELLELFTHRLIEYDAGVTKCAESAIAGQVAELLANRKRSRMAIAAGTPAGWLPSGYEFVEATSFDAHQLDRLDGVLTGCTVAIAETGSIVLQNADAQGPRAISLVPDYHLCLVFANQIVETVPEGFARLRPTASLPTTFFSGPSATADIEMTRIKGVHGPRFLDVLVVV